jgi:hypothetical protein
MAYSEQAKLVSYLVSGVLAIINAEKNQCDCREVRETTPLYNKRRATAFSVCYTCWMLLFLAGWHAWHRAHTKSVLCVAVKSDY